MAGHLRHLVLWIGILLASIANASRSDVLVVVNENSVDSVQIGEYYAEKRGIDPSRIARIRVPNQIEVTAMTLPSGFYRFDNLRDGTYQVRAGGAGGSYGQRTVTISRGNAVNVDFPAH